MQENQFSVTFSDPLIKSVTEECVFKKPSPLAASESYLGITENTGELV